MFRALGARLALDRKGVTGVALFEAAAQRMWLWATSGLKTAPDGLTDGELQEDGRHVTALRCESDNRSLCRLAVQRPDEWDQSTVWLTTVDAVRTGDTVEVGVSVEQDMRHLRVPPSPLAPPLVALLHDFVNEGATAGSQRLHSTPETVLGHGADRLVRALVPPRPGTTPPGHAFQRQEGGGRRLSA
jgi:hypothetical protein